MAERAPHRARVRGVAVLVALGAALTGCSDSTRTSGTIPDTVRVERGVVYAHVEGEALALDACTPKAGTAPLPLVVLVHGGSWISGSRTDLDFLCAEGAEHGFTAITVDYRLLPSAFPAQLDDVAGAVAFVRRSASRYRVDPDRVVLIGTSAGGSIVAGLLTGEPGSPVPPRSFRGGAMLSGIYDPRALGSRLATPQARPILTWAGCAALTACARALDRISATRHVTRGDPPEFLANSTGELTPASQPQAMLSAARRVDVRVELEWARGGNHAEDIVRYDPSVDAALWRFLRSTVTG